MSVLTKIFKRAGEMCKQATAVMKLTLVLSCMCCAASIVMLILSNGPGYSYDTYMVAIELSKLPQALLLVGVLGSAVVEDVRGN